MKQTLIKITDDHYVVVDDSEIKEGDWVVGCTRTVVQCMYPENVHHRDVKKITHSTQPIETFNWMGNSEKGYDTIKPLSLQEVKELIGEVDVEKKAEYNWMLHTEGSIVVTDKNDWKSGFHHGYTQALEDSKEKKYTEEDMITAFEKGTNAGALSERLYDYDNGDYEEAPQYYKQQKESFIQSLQSKTEWEVTFDEQGKLRLV